MQEVLCLKTRRMYRMYMKELVYVEVLLCLKIRGKGFDMKLFLYRPGEHGI
jgi:hypothetical protein